MGSSRTVFVTVGTTKFDSLVQAVDSQEVADVLVQKGYTHLVIQKGAGSYVPHVVVPAGSSKGNLPNGLSVEVFEFSPSLDSYISNAALVISHAGSGSIFETLTAGKPLLVVPNPLLMDNHQAELGDHLAAQQVLACATPDQLLGVLQSFDPATCKPFQKGSAAGIVARIDALMGRSAQQ